MGRDLRYRVYMPERLKDFIDKNVEEQPPGIKHFRKERLYFIVSLTYVLKARIKSKREPREYTPIKAEYLRDMFYDYKLYVDYLVKTGALLCDNLAIDNEKSYGYKVPEELEGEVKSYSVSALALSRKLVRKNYRTRKPKKRVKNERAKYVFLKNWFEGLQVDYDAAMEYITQKYGWEECFHDKETENKAQGKYNAAYISLQHLRDRNWYFQTDHTSGRLHTNLTNLSSDLRNFITWQGKPLVSVDISNSQPYLANALLLASFYRNGNGINYYRIIKSINSISFSPPGVPAGFPLTMKKLLQYIDKKEDIKTFKIITREGRLYEYLREVMEGNMDITGTIPRKRLKEIIFQVMYTGNRFMSQNKQLFRKMFPNVCKVFNQYKKEDKKFLAIFLQRLEAYLILDVIAKRINRENPGVPLFTIHDSLVTTWENVEYIKRVMAEELKKAVGTAPQFKTEYWRQEELQSKINQSA